MSFHRGIRHDGKLLHIDQVRFSQPLLLSENQVCLVFQLGKQANGFLIPTPKGFHDVLYGVDDIDTTLFINPTVLL